MSGEDQFRNLDVARWPQAVRIEWERVTRPDDHSTPEASGEDDPEILAQEEERAASWRRDEWGYIGVLAKATIWVPIGGNSFASYTLESPGLWGVEDDSGEEYLASVYADEKTALRDALAAIALAMTGGAQLIEGDAP